MRRKVVPTLSVFQVLFLLLNLTLASCLAATPRPRPTPTPEPLVPTVAPPLRGTRPSQPFPTPGITTVARPEGIRWRLGVGVPLGEIADYPYSVLGLGWYVDWQARPGSPPPGLTYVRVVRMQRGVLRQGPDALAQIARQHPGGLWLVGNEPDVAWQDNSTPEEYARAYRAAYQALKGADPTARVAVGGISQVTPLRLEYLDRVLEAYQVQFGEPMPADVWNVHTFILREERNSWGVGIPPGFEAVQQGTLWEIEDHDRLDLLQRQVLDIRRWLYNRGREGIPLVISEYGILMPAEYGFPPDRVATFLRGSFDLFLRLRDPVMGDPGDDYRLVQQWAWYSLADTRYPTGNLFHPEAKVLTSVGAAFATYAGD